MHATSSREESLKLWFNEFMNVDFTNFWEIRYFLVESDRPIEKMYDYAAEVFTDCVVETLFSSIDSNLEEYGRWLEHLTMNFMIQVLQC